MKSRKVIKHKTARKRRALIPAAIFAGITLFSCGSKSTNTPSDAAEDSTSLPTDSNQAKSGEAIAQKESPTSPDVKMYGFKGAVKGVSITRFKATPDGGSYKPATKDDNFSKTLTFNQQGLITKDDRRSFTYNEQGKFKRGTHDYTKLKRNEQNQIIEYDDNGPVEGDANYSITYKYSKDGYLASETFKGWADNCETTYKWDEEGRLISKTVEAEGESYQETSEESYKYSVTDEKGNWTERIVEVKTTTTIYEMGEDTEEQDNANTSKSVYIDKCKITYFE